jgi:hypothetical protein
MTGRYHDITCPVVDERALSNNADVTHDHPHQPHDSKAGAVLITAPSPLSLRNRVETLARYFRREFGYDFVNYLADERDPDCEAWLWTTRAEGRIYATGHAVFWKIAFADRPAPEWEMGSVWQHPYFRGHGRFSAIWSHWAQSYGAFWISHPWSPAMQAFMTGHASHEYPDGTTADKPLAAYRSRAGR